MRRQWVREGDLIIVWPWDFQDSKADVKHRYTKTQAMYLSRKGVLPDDVDMFGMGANVDDARPAFVPQNIVRRKIPVNEFGLLP